MALDKSLEQFNTPEYRASYARQSRDLAAWLRLIHHYENASYLMYIADLYDGNDVRWYTRRFD